MLVGLCHADDFSAKCEILYRHESDARLAVSVGILAGQFIEFKTHIAAFYLVSGYRLF